MYYELGCFGVGSKNFDSSFRGSNLVDFLGKFQSLHFWCQFGAIFVVPEFNFSNLKEQIGLNSLKNFFLSIRAFKPDLIEDASLW